MLSCHQVKAPVLFLLASLITRSVLAQPIFIGSFFEYDAVPPPVSLTWQLATPTGDHVDLTITGIQPAAGSERAYMITPANAAEFGVDFPAWSLAVNDPNYSRSIMTWAGLTKEQPVVRNFEHIELDDIRIFVDDYWWPVPGGNSPTVYIEAFAADFPLIPEPASWLLALLLITLLSIHPTSRCPQCTRLSRLAGW
jgi:hypothetical protein